MRTIQKSSPPDKLVEWRAKYKDDPNFGYALMRQDSDVTEAVVESLLQEQGRLCAYTGRPINEERRHIEHMLPQCYSPTGQREPRGVEEEACRGRDVDYTNMVACYPEPNHRRQLPYGAPKKGSWPPPSKEDEFVKPTQSDCEARFVFDRRGRVSTKDGDHRAAETCRRLNLTHPELTQLRKDAIQGVLNPRGKGYPGKAGLRKALAKLESESGRLTWYCFSTKQALAHLIRKAA